METSYQPTFLILRPDPHLPIPHSLIVTSDIWCLQPSFQPQGVLHRARRWVETSYMYGVYNHRSTHSGLCAHRKYARHKILHPSFT